MCRKSSRRSVQQLKNSVGRAQFWCEELARHSIRQNGGVPDQRCLKPACRHAWRECRNYSAVIVMCAVVFLCLDQRVWWLQYLHCVQKLLIKPSELCHYHTVISIVILNCCGYKNNGYIKWEFIFCLSNVPFPFHYHQHRGIRNACSMLN